MALVKNTSCLSFWINLGILARLNIFEITLNHNFTIFPILLNRIKYVYVKWVAAGVLMEQMSLRWQQGNQTPLKSENRPIFNNW